MVKQFAHFHVVGALGAGVNLATLYLAHGLLGLWVYPSLVIAFSVAVTFNFLAIKQWTFRDTCWAYRHVARQYVRFYSIAVTGLLVNLAVFYCLHEIGGVRVYWSQALAITIVAPVHFFLNRFFTFPAPAEAAQDPETDLLGSPG